MQESKIRNYLEVITNAAVLLAALGVLSALSWGYFAQRQSTLVTSGFQRGQVVARVPQIDYSVAAQTLLIVMNTNCHFCTESIPFYNELIKMQRGKEQATRIIALFPNQSDEVKQYSEQNQFQAETVSEVDLAKLNVSGTPTLILVDGHGTILDFWSGKLSKDVEQQVSSRLK